MIGSEEQNHWPIDDQIRDLRVSMDEYIQVPVPKRFVSSVYALLAELTLKEEIGVARSSVSGSQIGAPEQGKTPRLQTSPQNTLRYQLLEEYFRKESNDMVTLTRSRIEEICTGMLPKSAGKHRAWWANTDSHSHAQSWLRAGFRVARVVFEEQDSSNMQEQNDEWKQVVVTFRRY